MSGMHPEMIRAEIKMKGLSLADVAAMAGIGESTVRQALRKPSTAGEMAIGKDISESLNAI